MTVSNSKFNEMKLGGCFAYERSEEKKKKKKRIDTQKLSVQPLETHNKHGINKDRLISIVSVVVALVIGLHSSFLQIQISNKSGAFDKPKAEAYIGGLKLDEVKKNRIIYGLPLPQDAKASASFPVIVKNIGEETLIFKL